MLPGRLKWIMIHSVTLTFFAFVLIDDYSIMQNSFELLRTISRRKQTLSDPVTRRNSDEYPPRKSDDADNFKRRRIESCPVEDVIFARLENNGCLIFLKPGQNLYFKGRTLMRVLAGKLRILGKFISGDTDQHYYPLYSLPTHSLLCMEGITPEGSVQSIRKEQIAEEFQLGLREIDDSIIAKCAAVVHLKSLAEDGFDHLCSQYSIMRSLSLQPMDTTAFNPARGLIEVGIPGFAIVQSHDAFSSTEFPQLLPDEWVYCAQDIFNQGSIPVVCVCGSKNMGKSTFSRLLLNTGLNQHQQIAYLDCDLGQSEFTAPGVVSLSVVEIPVFGPPYTHQRPPLIAKFIGQVSSEPDPTVYLTQLIGLYRYYERHLKPQGIPLIINTQGWVTGIGYDLLIGLLQHTCPSDLIELVDKSQPPGVGKNMPDIKVEGQLLENPNDSWVNAVPLERLQCWSLRHHYIESHTVTFPKSPFSPTDNRTITFMSLFAHAGYLSDDDHKIAKQTMSWRFRPVTSMLPYFISYSNIRLEHIHAEIKDYKEIMASMNAGLVGLLSPADDDDEDNDRFVTWGVVRAMETPLRPSINGLYVLVPPHINLSTLQSVSILRKGSVELPQNISYQDVAIKSGPYADNTCIDGLSGQSMRKVRRNILRGWAKGGVSIIQ